MKKLFFLLILFLNIEQTVYSQFRGFYEAKEFSKEVSLFRAKMFLFQEVLNDLTDKSTQFEAIPLAAASSGELTTLLYKCESENTEGLIFGFYGNYWNEAGVSYQGYGFKNLSKERAYDFFNKIESEIEKNTSFMKKKNDENNIVFKFDDIEVLIWTTVSGFKIRLFWNGFDSTWEETSYSRSKRRFERKSK